MLHYEKPTSIPNALHILSEGQRTVLAGGTDVYPATKAQILAGPVLDLTGISDLRRIEKTPDGLLFGACTTWSDIIAADLPPACDALKLAATEVGARQIQNVGTIAGNVCNASPAADGVPPLLILDTEIDIASTRGSRRLPLTEFIKGVRKTALAADEIVTGLFVPKTALVGTSTFLKLGARKHLVISIAMVAVRLDVFDGKVAQASISVGSCSAKAVRVLPAEAILAGRDAKAGLSETLSDADIASSLSPIDDVRGTADYRNRAAAELVRRAVEGALP